MIWTLILKHWPVVGGFLAMAAFLGWITWQNQQINTLKGKLAVSQHDAIIDMKTWNHAQGILDKNKLLKINFSVGERPYLLKGLLRGPDGYAMTPATAKKGKKRYRYYVNVKASKTHYDDCTLKSVSAPILEEIILDQAKRVLTSSEWIQRMLENAPENKADILDVRAALDNFEVLWAELFPAEQARIIQLIISKIIIYPKKLIIHFQPPGMASVLHELLPDLKFDKNTPEMHEPLVMNIKIDFKKSRNRSIITSPDGKDLTKSLAPQYDNALVKAIVRAHQWEDMIEKGQASSITDIAAQEKLDRGYITSVIKLTGLAPDITTAILNGRQPQALQLSSIIRKNLPYCWNKQREMLGFEACG